MSIITNPFKWRPVRVKKPENHVIKLKMDLKNCTVVMNPSDLPGVPLDVIEQARARFIEEIHATVINMTYTSEDGVVHMMVMSEPTPGEK